MTDRERIAKINNMSRMEICRLWRFAGDNHPLMSGEPGKRLTRRFSELGGFSPGISRALGWDGITLHGSEYR